MSQQINLLAPQPRDLTLPVSAAVLAVFALAAVLPARSGWQETTRLRAEAEQARQNLARVRTAVARAQSGQPQTSASELQAEIASLRPRAASADEFLRQLDSGMIGRHGGYSGHLEALGRIADDGVWLTGMAITRAGAGVSLDGAGLSNEAVLLYSRRATASFAPLGAQFRSLDIRPASSPGGSAGAAGASAVTFKLS